MWLLVARERRPGQYGASGRRWLSALDAALWPLLWVLLFSHVPKPVGIVGPFVAAVALLCALVRLHRALWLNHRYWFTTWRWGQMAAALMLMGLALKLSLPG
jgi:hypothetical protein